MRLLTYCTLIFIWLMPSDAFGQYRGYRGNNNWNGNNWHHGYYQNGNYRRVAPYWYFGLGSIYAPYYYQSYPQPYYTYDSTLTVPRTSLYYDAPSVTNNAPPAVSANQARLEIRVPSLNDTILVEGQVIAGTGYVRQMITPELQTGRDYTYNITLRRSNAISGQREESRTVEIKAGGNVLVDFTQPAATRLPLPRGPNPFGP